MIQKYKKILSCTILLIIFIILTYLIKNYFKPFFIVVLMIFVCNPIFNFLQKYKMFNRKISALITIAIVNLLILIFLFILGNCVVEQVNIFMDTVYINLKDSITELLTRLSRITNINFSIRSLSATDGSILNSEYFKRGAVYTTDGIFAYFIGNIIVYFTLVDKKSIIEFFSRLIYEENIDFLIRKYKDINKLIKIEIALVIITTIETIFGFITLNIDNGIFLGVLSGILDILPYVGTIIIFLPLILYKFYIGQYIIASGLILLYLLLIFSRQVMEAKFMSSKLQIHPLPIILSLYIGMKVFGLIGLFIGPIYVITAKEIIMS